MTSAVKETAKFLKSTLRLPASKFPARPAPTDLAKYLPRCTDELYAWQRQSRPAENAFVLHDGPPYANGDLHVGHALNKIIKDIICRTKLAEGRRVDFVPGWDCHGLPIELKALEKNGWKRGQVDSVTIRKAARKFAYDTVKQQMKGFRSWGVMADWDNHWKTLDKDFELRQLNVFRQMAQRGLIYRRNKPVYWSPSSGTALAEAEVDYKDDYISTAAIIKFPLRGTFGESVHAVIWTTTPWTIPANQAIAINKSMNYVIASSRDHGRLVVAASRVSYIENQIGQKLTSITPISVADLLECTYNGPAEFDIKDRPIVHADFVKDDSGTGLVHCAPGHGKDDFQALQPLIKLGKVEVRAPVDDHGRYTAAAAQSDLLTGMYVYGEGNQKVLDHLAGGKFLLSSYKFKHKYTIDWRTKEPVMTRATAQWFADVSSIKEATLTSLDSVSFKPASGASRLRSFVENRSEWCISRQRAWGVPIPALYHNKTGEALLTPHSIDHIISTIKERGIDAWWSDSPDEPAWLPEGVSGYSRGTDTMDVWFDSGTSWTSMLGEHNRKGVADVYLEGSDQHRGWFQSSLLTSIAYQTPSTVPAHAPYRTLVTHGFTLDANERKMSKSEGNVIAPEQIIAGLTPTSKAVQPKTSTKHRQLHPHGPDALRLWAASSDWTRDVVISEKVVSTVHSNLDKYRVTLKLLLGLLQDFDCRNRVDYAELSEVDRIAMLQLYDASNSVRAAFGEFEFHKAIGVINKWVTTELSGFYFEAIKDVIYCDSPLGSRRRSAQTTLYNILQQFQHMLGPITPLLVEESFECSPECVRTSDNHPLRRPWVLLPSRWNDQQLSAQIPLIMAINSSVKTCQERARADKLMGQSLGSDVLVYTDSSHTISDSSLQEILVVSAVSSLAKQANKDEIVQSLIDRGSWAYVQEIPYPASQSTGFVVVTGPAHGKCARCWKYEVPAERVRDAAEPVICKRCEDVIRSVYQ